MMIMIFVCSLTLHPSHIYLPLTTSHGEYQSVGPGPLPVPAALGHAMPTQPEAPSCVTATVTPPQARAAASACQ